MDDPTTDMHSWSSITASRGNARRVAVNLIRYIVGSVFIILGKPLLERHLITFVFHEVSNEPRAHAKETRTFSSVKTFQRQIIWIQESFKVRNLKDDGNPDGVGECIISFDDGYAGVKLNALPLLEKAGMPFICFINMATIKGEVNSSALAMYVAGIERRPVDWRNSNPFFYARALEDLSGVGRRKVEEYQGPYLTSEELDSLSSSSLVTIGDHLYNHWLLDELSEFELANELARGQKELLKFDSYRSYFAAPHGSASQGALRVLQKYSFRRVFSGSEVQFLDGMEVFPRIDLNDEIANRQQFFGAIVISMLRPYLQRLGNARNLFKVRIRNIS